MVIQGFWRRSLRPWPSAGTNAGLAANIGASGNFSMSVVNGLAPMGMGPSLRPTIIESRKPWQSATTAIAGAPNVARDCSEMGPMFFVFVHQRTRRPPTTPVMMTHSRNEPSWPAQNAEKV